MRRTATCLFVLLLTPAAAFSQQVFARTAVSVNGLDSNPCTTTEPCRSIGRALTQTVANGELIVLDSGGYGPFTVTLPVTIEAAPGVYAGITATVGQGVDVAVLNGNTVILRGLTIRAVITGQAVHGINLAAFGAILVVDNCFITGATRGISQTGENSRLMVLDSKFINGGDGVHVETTQSQGTARAGIDGCRFERNGGFAVSGFGNARITTSNSVMHENFIAFTNGMVGDFGIEMNIENCVAAYGSSGMYVTNTGAVMRVSNSISVNHANIGFGVNMGAVFETRGNNMVRGNGTNIFNNMGTMTVLGGN